MASYTILSVCYPVYCGPSRRNWLPNGNTERMVNASHLKPIYSLAPSCNSVFFIGVGIWYHFVQLLHFNLTLMRGLSEINLFSDALGTRYPLPASLGLGHGRTHLR